MLPLTVCMHHNYFTLYTVCISFMLHGQPCLTNNLFAIVTVIVISTRRRQWICGCSKFSKTCPHQYIPSHVLRENFVRLTRVQPRTLSIFRSCVVIGLLYDVSERGLTRQLRVFSCTQTSTKWLSDKNQYAQNTTSVKWTIHKKFTCLNASRYFDCSVPYNNVF